MGINYECDNIFFLKRVPYLFDYERKSNKLSSGKNLFFKPYQNINDALQQWKTAPVSLLIGARSVCISLLALSFDLCQLAISIPCLSPELFLKSLVEVVADIGRLVIVPTIAVIVASSSLVSLFTRAAGTVLCPDLDKGITQPFIDSMYEKKEANYQETVEQQEELEQKHEAARYNLFK